MVEPLPMAIEYAIDLACNSPCRKSKRGAVLYTGNVLVHGACNGPPIGWGCTGTSDCKTLCGRRCMHAEERVFVGASLSIDFPSSEMVHVKVKFSKLVPSGPPSCWQCSRTIQDLQLGGMWLYHEDGWRRYGAEEFNQLTLENCGMLLKG